MKGKIIGLAVIIVCFIIACNKDKFQTKPTIQLKSISSKIIPVGSDMSVELTYTDKEGDIMNDTLQLIKVRNNKRFANTIRDTLYLKLPDFPSDTKGVLEAKLQYENHLKSAEPPPNLGTGKESDSLTFKFILKDNQSNISDTLVINDIVIERQ